MRRIRVRFTPSPYSTQDVQSGLLPGAEIMGSGYDPFSYYASSKGITYQVFDWSKTDTKIVNIRDKSYLVPVLMDVDTNESADYVDASGESINEFQSSLATSASIEGSYNFFSGSLEAEFNESTLTKSEFAFSRLQESLKLWSLKINPRDSTLTNLLKPDFKTALNGGDPANLFDTYGSHFLTGIKMGGSAFRSAATNKVSVSKSYDISVLAQESYKGAVGKLSATEKAKYEESINSFNSSSELIQGIVGGNADKALNAFRGDDAEFKKWVATVPDAPAFIDFTPLGPLSPIWLLCTEAKRQTELQDFYVNTWAPNRSNGLGLYPAYIDALSIVSGNASTVPPTSGYQRLDFDLNKGAGGDFIYLCYHKATYDPELKSNPQCIEDLRVIFDQEPTPSGFVKLPQDLNKSVGGAYVYLCYKLGPFTNNAAIKSITAVSASYPSVTPPYGFTKLEGDLNKGAGGDFIYLCYSTSL